MTEQRKDNIDKTKQFFDEWTSYHETVKKIDTWKLYGEAISKQIKNGVILDIGNGGIFNYDTSKAKKIIAIDLSPNLISNAPREADNIEYRVGNIIELDYTAAEFDQAVMDMLVHHLAGKNFAVTKSNVLKSFENTYRVLKPGGELIIMESCLPELFEFAEKNFFFFFRIFTGLLGHPVVFQWNRKSLENLLRQSGFKNITMDEVKLGKWIIQLGFKIPAVLSPAKAYIIKAVK
jgi:ubiquinone/menaquinone biosynthesis C-methylase UbiE